MYFGSSNIQRRRMKLQELLNYTNSVVIAMALMCMFDVGLRFKKFSALKLSLLGLSFFFFLAGIGGLWEYHVEYNRVLQNFSVTLSAFSGVIFFALLLSPKSTRIVFITFISTFLFQVSQSFYYYYKFGYGLNVDLMKNAQTSAFLIWARIILMLFVLPIPISLVIRLRKKFDEDNFYYQRLRAWSLGVIFVFILDLSSYLIRLNRDYVLQGRLVASLAHLMSLILVLYRPKFLNKMSGNISFLSLFSYKSKEQVEPERFNRAFFDDCFFLLSNVNILDFSKKINWVPEDISVFVESQYGMSFEKLIEKQRVEYFMALVSNGRSKGLSLDQLAEASGFSSKADLQRSFTEVHGGSAMEYILVHSAQ